MGTDDGNEITWHVEVLPRATRRALDVLSDEAWLKRSRWYLAGGSALALYMGHRQSVDLDFFYPTHPGPIRTVLSRLSKHEWKTDVVKEGTVYGRLSGAKVSFIAYPFFQMREQPRWYGAVRVLVPKDIAVMKIIAISQRGKKRDFVDLYWYVRKQEPLADILRRLPNQYPNLAHNYHHIVNSLVYFADADPDPMPELFFTAHWKEIKEFFRVEVPKVTKELLQLPS